MLVQEKDEKEQQCPEQKLGAGSCYCEGHITGTQFSPSLADLFSWAVERNSEVALKPLQLSKRAMQVAGWGSAELKWTV